MKLQKIARALSREQFIELAAHYYCFTGFQLAKAARKNATADDGADLGSTVLGEEVNEIEHKMNEVFEEDFKLFKKLTPAHSIVALSADEYRVIWDDLANKLNSMSAAIYKRRKDFTKDQFTQISKDNEVRRFLVQAVMSPISTDR